MTRYLACLLLISCAGHKVKVDGSFGAVKGSVTVTETKKPEITARVPVRTAKPQNRLLPPRVPRPARVITPKLAVPAPVIFAIGRARPIPILWASSVAAACKAHKVILVGNSSPDGKLSRNKELACLRARNGRTALIRAGCNQENISIKWITGKTRSLAVEVL